MCDFMGSRIHFVIPARSGSSLRDKNWREYGGEALLPKACRKCREAAAELPLAVLTDSEVYAERLGWDYVPYVDVRHGDRDDVTWALGRYVRWVGDEDVWLVMVQCTSPLLGMWSIASAVRWARQGPARERVLMSVVRWRHKVTALHLLRDDGTLAQVGARLPEPSVARQLLPTGSVFTGGVTVVHGSRVVRGARSLFEGAVRVPLLVREEEALDIDRVEDFDR